MKFKALIVDDDKDFLKMLERYLLAADYDVLTAPNVKSALALLSKKLPDIIVSDVEMPGASGVEFVKILRENPKFSFIPVVLMSGKKISEIDMLEGYKKGSDDYLVKPFSMQVFSAKISNMLKARYPNKRKGNKLLLGKMELDLDARKFFLAGKEKKLSKKEFDILHMLILSKNKVVSYEKILDSVWGYGQDKYSDIHTIETHIYSLRKKTGLGKAIKNVSGHGYMLEI